MKHSKYLTMLASLALVLSVGAFAKSKDEGKMQLTGPVEIGATHLTPGSYKVEWNGTGQQVHVNIMQHGKTIATTPAKLVEHATPSPYDAVVTRTGKNKVAHVDEIDFNNRKEALVLMPNTMAKK